MVKPSKTFKMPKTMKRSLILMRGDSHQKGEVKNLMIQAELAAINFKNKRPSVKEQ